MYLCVLPHSSYSPIIVPLECRTTFVCVFPTGCELCRDIISTQLPGMTFVLDSVLLESLAATGKEHLQRRINARADFLKIVNALLNEGGGIICVHAVDLHLLGKFDEAVNSHMAKLIPDDSPYHENFERHAKGKNHVIIRVKTKARPLSTCYFHTKIALDKGVEDPTHGQLRYLLQKREDDEESSGQSVSFAFTEDSEVEIMVDKEDSVFQESMNIQAKAIADDKSSSPPSCQDKGNADDKSKLAPFFDKSKNTYLPRYVSAQTKLKRGGSVFLGIKEDSSSGTFTSKGIVWNRDDVQDFLLQQIKKNTFWYPDQLQREAGQAEGQQDFQPPVQVVFHAVQGGQGKVVVEVKVDHYRGMVFLDSAGPVAYHIPTLNTGGPENIENIVQVDKKQWFKEVMKPMEDTEMANRS